MYDQEANTQNAPQTRAGHKGQVDAVGHSHGKHNPMYLRVGYGNRLHVRFVGQRSGQRRDLQNDFTRFFYTYRRHDWIPEWYQAYAK